jgi:indolepyruvate ferredoxin oxidoreductase
VVAIDANELAERLCGDAVYANVIMLGAAWQRGVVPVSFAALMRAIELNAVETEPNKTAFAIGRLAAADPATVAPLREPAEGSETLDAVITRRVNFLAGYQNPAWAERYRALVERVRAAEHGSEALTEAVARSLFKLMSYKDEYEVARLHVETDFIARLKQDFEGDFKIALPFRMLSRLKRLRATPFDPFGYTMERRMERGLIIWYEELIESMLRALPRYGSAVLIPIAAAPMEIRGYGPVKLKAANQTRALVDSLMSSILSADHT